MPRISVGINIWLSLCLYSRFCGYSYLCILFIVYGALYLHALRCLSLLLPGQTGSSILKSSSMLGNSLLVFLLIGSFWGIASSVFSSGVAGALVLTFVTCVAVQMMSL